MTRRLLWALSLLLVGCGPSLVVRHQDPTNTIAEIWVDGYRVGRVSYEDTLSVSLSPGRHIIKAVPPGRTDSPWHAGRLDFPLVVEDDAVMTLLPRASP